VDSKGKIYEAIPKIMAEVGAVAKGHKNPQQGYQYRAIDDVMGALQGIMAKHGVFVFPRVSTERTEHVKIGQKGTPMVHVFLVIEYRFCAVDGSEVVASAPGEAMDTGDKAANKAMASALKYVLTQTFMIPTSDPKDTELASPELSPQDEAAMDHNGEQEPAF